MTAERCRSAHLSQPLFHIASLKRLIHAFIRRQSNGGRLGGGWRGDMLHKQVLGALSKKKKKKLCGGGGCGEGNGGLDTITFSSLSEEGKKKKQRCDVPPSRPPCGKTHGEIIAALPAARLPSAEQGPSCSTGSSAPGALQGPTSTSSSSSYSGCPPAEEEEGGKSQN